MIRKYQLLGCVIVVLLLITACSFPTTTSRQENVPDTGVESENPAQNQDEIKNDSDSSSLSCFDATDFVLQADHTLTVNEAETSITHILKQGGIALTRTDDTTMGDYALSTVSPQALSYEVIGIVGPCSMEANGIMLLSATGFCQDGIIYLSINENWQPAQGTMTCDDQVTQLNIPGYSATHTGPYGTGEEFLIVNDNEGYTVMRAFEGGDGYHSWTLRMDIPVVPISE